MDNADKVGYTISILVGKFLGRISLYEKLPQKQKDKEATIILDQMLKDFHFAIDVAEKVVVANGVETKTEAIEKVS